MDEDKWLEDIKATYSRLKTDCEKATAQVSDEKFFVKLGPHSVAIQLKHVGCNLKSRWRDFLTTDGEKRDRDREGEFSAEGETRESIMAYWKDGWRVAFDELSRLGPDDLERSITIRGEPMSVVRAINRNLTHVAYHAGQLVQLARYHAGDSWQTLSVAPGKTDEHNAAMRARFGDWWEK